MFEHIGSYRIWMLTKMWFRTIVFALGWMFGAPVWGVNRERGFVEDVNCAMKVAPKLSGACSPQASRTTAIAPELARFKQRHRSSSGHHWRFLVISRTLSVIHPRGSGWHRICLLHTTSEAPERGATSRWEYHLVWLQTMQLSMHRQALMLEPYQATKK